MRWCASTSALAAAPATGGSLWSTARFGPPAMLPLFDIRIAAPVLRLTLSQLRDRRVDLTDLQDVFLVTGYTVDYQPGVSDDQIEQHIRCAIGTSEGFFEALKERIVEYGSIGADEVIDYTKRDYTDPAVAAAMWLR